MPRWPLSPRELQLRAFVASIRAEAKDLQAEARAAAEAISALRRQMPRNEWIPLNIRAQELRSRERFWRSITRDRFTALCCGDWGLAKVQRYRAEARELRHLAETLKQSG